MLDPQTTQYWTPKTTPHGEPTLAEEPPIPPRQRPMRSVLRGRTADQPTAEENIRRMIERTKGLGRPGPLY
jgi:hypothetical protein